MYMQVEANWTMPRFGAQLVPCVMESKYKFKESQVPTSVSTLPKIS